MRYHVWRDGIPGGLGLRRRLFYIRFAHQFLGHGEHDGGQQLIAHRVSIFAKYSRKGREYLQPQSGIHLQSQPKPCGFHHAF